MVIRSRVLSAGSYLPSRIVTNDELAKTIDTSDEWIRQRTGIRQRHIAAEGELTSDLALAASEQALKNAGLKGSDIDCIILGTCTPDHTFPATATKVQPAHGTHAHLEVSLADQVLVVVDGQGGAVAVDATTGAESTPTPPGTFSVFRQVDAWDPGPYGSLYRPKYFNGGIALHGGTPVVAAPASHTEITVSRLNAFHVGRTR